MQLFWNFVQSMAVSLPCSVQNFEMIRQQTDVMDVHGFKRLEFEMSFQQIFSIAQHPWGPS